MKEEKKNKNKKPQSRGKSIIRMRLTGDPDVRINRDFKIHEQMWNFAEKWQL